MSDFSLSVIEFHSRNGSDPHTFRVHHTVDRLLSHYGLCVCVLARSQPHTNQTLRNRTHLTINLNSQFPCVVYRRRIGSIALGTQPKLRSHIGPLCNRAFYIPVACGPVAHTHLDRCLRETQHRDVPSPVAHIVSLCPRRPATPRRRALEFLCEPRSVHVAQVVSFVHTHCSCLCVLRSGRNILIDAKHIWTPLDSNAVFATSRTQSFKKNTGILFCYFSCRSSGSYRLRYLLVQLYIVKMTTWFRNRIVLLPFVKIEQWQVYQVLKFRKKSS